MKEDIRLHDSDAEFYTPERCYINELSNHADDAAVSIAQARVKSGISTRWHRLHGITERYVMLEGEGLVEIGELRQQVHCGDVALIPAGCRQRITNVGKSDLVFLAICTPRFQQADYEDIDTEPLG